MSGDFKTEILSKLIDSVPVLLIFFGIALLILGLSGGITYNGWLPILEPTARIGGVALGISGIGFGI